MFADGPPSESATKAAVSRIVTTWFRAKVDSIVPLAFATLCRERHGEPPTMKAAKAI